MEHVHLKGDGLHQKICGVTAPYLAMLCIFLGNIGANAQTWQEVTLDGTFTGFGDHLRGSEGQTAYSFSLKRTVPQNGDCWLEVGLGIKNQALFRLNGYYHYCFGITEPTRIVLPQEYTYLFGTDKWKPYQHNYMTIGNYYLFYGAGRGSFLVQPLSFDVISRKNIRPNFLMGLTQDLAVCKATFRYKAVDWSPPPEPVKQAVQQETPAINVAKKETAIQSSTGQRWAVIIGVSTYQDSKIPSLRYASSDAQSFYDWCISSTGGKYTPSKTKLLLDGEATSKNMKKAIFNWLGDAIKEDIITIYFSGHGSPQSPDHPNNLFLLPYDTQYDDISTSAFPMWDMETALKRYIKAKRVIVIADACHAGGVGESFDIVRKGDKGIMVNTINSGIQALSEVGEGICVISASDNQQLSQEGQQWGSGHGVFTYHLLEGLKGKADYSKDDVVTLGELIPYLSENVRRETKSAQCPTVAGKFDPALSIGK